MTAPGPETSGENGGAADGDEIVAGPPDPATYLTLRRAGGLSPFTKEAARRGLPNSLHCVTVRRGRETVGMGRIVGDGGAFFQIVDIVVDPAHRRRGLGRQIMAALLAHLRAHAPASAYVSLIADRPADRLYAAFGFAETAPQSVGIAITL